ncbi:hypothetical protein PGT21_034371 [Puccinia graminis f. sp. tritici]|uniref:Uncharacterized protein n=1 Tax=Puccinia graminis f. sp. tritici TaxID=56615 RepID=A0A5B0MHY1_PUCGR|nr:hypothetical protein PGT21_034371 [Puccinia graminis f. sp. tritici]
MYIPQPGPTKDPLTFVLRARDALRPFALSHGAPLTRDRNQGVHHQYISSKESVAYIQNIETKMDVPTPRVSSSLLGQYVGQVVRISGKVISVRMSNVCATVVWRDRSRFHPSISKTMLDHLD